MSTDHTLFSGGQELNGTSKRPNNDFFHDSTKYVAVFVTGTGQIGPVSVCCFYDIISYAVLWVVKKYFG